MSNDNTKATGNKKSSNKDNKALNEALKATLEETKIEFVPLHTLVISPLNVRTVPYTAEEVRRTADSIHAIGLLQNLVIHTLPDGLNGVAAGGKRLTSLNLLLEEGKLTAETLINVKRLPEDLARAASITENSDHKVMHPAEQIVGFRDLAAEGKTEAQIGALFGYSSRHVQRCLKMANLAPALLKLLAQDQISVEICQVLSLENDQERQVQVWENARESFGFPSVNLIKNMITTSEVNVLSSALFSFVGRETYEAAGGVVREDLFSSQNGEGYADKILLEKLATEKLTEKALKIQSEEGWSWCLSRWSEIVNYGEDRRNYCFYAEPELVYSPEEETLLADLNQRIEESDSDKEAIELQERIAVIEDQAIARGWTAEQKADSGVVISYNGGYIRVQRGVSKIEHVESEEPNPAVCSEVQNNVKETPKAIDEFSATLVKAMSCERTLAVQAAASQQTKVGVALLTWTYCLSIFGRSARTGDNPLKANITNNRYTLVDLALTGKEGKAYAFLEGKKEDIAKALPEEWEKNFTWLLEWPESDVSSLLGFCVAFGINGIQERLYNVTDTSPLEDVEAALKFDLRDWWQPTATGYFCKLSKDQIIDVLSKNDLNDVAAEASKLKKGEAAVLAEKAITESRWVPEWMKPPMPAGTESDSDTPSTDSSSDNA